IAITPNDTNGIGESHTFTITLTRNLNDGAGYVPFSGQTVTAAVTAGACTGPTPATGATDANGLLRVVVVRTTPGSCTVTGSFNGQVIAGATESDTTVNISTNGLAGNSDPA